MNGWLNKKPADGEGLNPLYLRACMVLYGNSVSLTALCAALYCMSCNSIVPIRLQCGHRTESLNLPCSSSTLTGNDLPHVGQ